MKRSVYILFVLIAGVLGAVLRGLSITRGLEWSNGLPVRGDLSSLALKVLCVLVLVLAIVLSRSGYAKQGQQYEAIMGTRSATARWIGVLSAVGVVLVGVGAVLCTNRMVVEQTSEYHPFGVTALIAQTVQWILCIVSGVLLVGFAKRQDGREATKAQGLRVAVPMLWACLMLVMAYHENSGNPVMSDYAYELLLAIAVLASFYAIACLFFAEASARRVALFCGLSVFLIMTVVGGLLVGAILDATMLSLTLMAPTADLLRMAAYLMTGIYLLVQLVGIAPKTTEE